MESVRIALKEERSHTCKRLGIKLMYGKHVDTSNPDLIKYCRSYPEKFSVTLLKVSEEEIEDNKQVSSQQLEEKQNSYEVTKVEKPKKRGRKPGKKKVERKAVLVDND